MALLRPHRLFTRAAMTLTRVNSKRPKAVVQLVRIEPNAVPNAKSRQFTVLDESVDGCATEPEESCNIRHTE